MAPETERTTELNKIWKGATATAGTTSIGLLIYIFTFFGETTSQLSELRAEMKHSQQILQVIQSELAKGRDAYLTRDDGALYIELKLAPLITIIEGLKDKVERLEQNP